MFGGRRLIPEAVWLCFCAALGLGEWLASQYLYFYPLWPFFAFVSFVTLLFAIGASSGQLSLISTFFLGITLAFIHASPSQAFIEQAHCRGGAHPLELDVRIIGNPRTMTLSNGGKRIFFTGDTGSTIVEVEAPASSVALPPSDGESWHVKGWLSHARPRSRSANLRVRALGKDCGVTKLPSPADRSRSLYNAIRADLSRRISLSLPRCKQQGNTLAHAILLGDRSGISKEDRLAFVDSGSIHVFAISGLHVMAIAHILRIAFSAMLIPMRLNAILSAAFLWFYVWLTGSAPSSVRAAVMASFSLLTLFFNRRPCHTVSWSVAFITTHAINPSLINNVSSAYSFVVMLYISILLSLAQIRKSSHDGKLPGWKKRALDNLIFTIVAWAAGVPISAAVFSRIVPGGLISSIVAVPLAGAVITMQLLSIAVSFIAPIASCYLNSFVSAILSVMVGVARLVASIPWANFQIRPWGMPECLLWYAGLSLILYLFFLSLVRHKKL